VLANKKELPVRKLMGEVASGVRSSDMRNYTDTKHEKIFQFQKSMTTLRHSTEEKEKQQTFPSISTIKK
jgi:hypothetical protein